MCNLICSSPYKLYTWLYKNIWKDSFFTLLDNGSELCDILGRTKFVHHPFRISQLWAESNPKRLHQHAPHKYVNRSGLAKTKVPSTFLLYISSPTLIPRELNESTMLHLSRTKTWFLPSNIIILLLHRNRCASCLRSYTCVYSVDSIICGFR
jgi:hypothetical protein